MIRGLYTAVSGMIAEEAKQQNVSNNLANANTCGYKKEDLRFKDFKEVLLHNYDKVVGGKNKRQNIGYLSNGVKIDEVVTEFTQGSIIETNKKTDFAIEGPGFFTVEGQNAQRFYTRDGKFHVDSNGYLVNNNGYYVLGTNLNNNNVERIRVNNDTIKCNDNGEISLNGRRAYRFSCGQFANKNDLTKVGESLFRANRNPVGNEGIVKQGHIEKSNVNLVNEMVDLMTVMRNFESDQKVVQTMDQTLGKLINEVGNVK